MLGILCQICNQRPATTHITEAEPDTGEVHELHICGSCLRSLDLHPDQPPPSVAELLSKHAESSTTEPGHAEDQGSKISINLKPPTSKALISSLQQCPECGLSFANFTKHNRFGCPACYDAFGSDLERALEEIHGGSRHVGRLPQHSADDGERRMSRRLHLQRRLDQAVAEEDFEAAAQIRDHLQQIADAGVDQDDGEANEVDRT